MEQQSLSLEAIPVSTASQDVFERLRHETENETDEAAIAAENMVETVGLSESFPLSALLQQEGRLHRRDIMLAFLWISTFLGSVILLTDRIAIDSISYSAYITLFLGLLLATGTSVVGYLWRSYSRRKHAFTRVLAQHHDLQQVGPLIQATRMDNIPVRNLAKRALIDLLPTLQASDAALLGDKERVCLVRLLARSPNDTGNRDLMEFFSRSAYRREIDLRVSILKALEQVGGAKELPAVARLSRGGPNLMSASFVPQEIHKAAQECLPFLRQRAEEQREGAQLLRASSAYITPNEELLRPTLAPTETPPAQLLRADEIRLDSEPSV